MAFQPGQSGNPKGRPPKERALTTLLEKAGSQTLEVDGKRITGKVLVARLVWEFVTTGRAELPPVENEDGEMVRRWLVADTDQWLQAVKWLYAHVDGPAKAVMEHRGSTDEPVRLIHVTEIEVAPEDSDGRSD